MQDYSKSGKKEKDGGKPTDVRLEKVVTGEVIKRKPPIGRRIKDVFFGGDAKATAQYVIADVLLPAFRDMLFDSVTRGAQRMVYGDSAPRHPHGSRTSPFTASQTYTPYSKVSSPIVSSGVRANLPDQPSRPRPHRGGMEIILSSREEAELVLEQLDLVIGKYDFVTVWDLNDLLGIEPNFVDQKWGWTSIVGSNVRQIREGFLLTLPDTEPLE